MSFAEGQRVQIHLQVGKNGKSSAENLLTLGLRFSALKT